MSWELSASIREMFAELAATNDEKTVFVRTLSRKDHLVSGLQEAVQQLPSNFTPQNCNLTLQSDLEKITLREHWGEQVAFLTTEGFESLLEIEDQRRTNTFGPVAQKKSPYVPRELSFGITERTLSDGSIERAVNLEEIEFVHSKLQIAEIKTVVVCFLHSIKNPANEKSVSDYLKQKGYQVFTSFELENAKDLNERERATLLSEKAYCASAHGEFLEDCKKIGFSPDQIRIRQNTKQNDKQLYLHLYEDRFYLEQGEKKTSLSINPLSSITRDNQGLVHIGATQIDAEPGPVCFGKGLSLCLLDVIQTKTGFSFENLNRLKIDSAKLSRTLGPIAKGLKISPEMCAEKFFNLAIEIIAYEIDHYCQDHEIEKISALGWFAPILAPQIEKHLQKSIFLPKHCEWGDLRDLAKDDKIQEIIVQGQVKFNA